ncbi:MAG: cytidine deaminase [Veillonellaceae bacterium]|nr:cytidine deaminase [Veillonellaceae bacterium]
MDGTVNEDIIAAMVRMAKESRRNAYTPQTGVAVGACVMASDGSLYGGCNIENMSPALSCCAESVTMYKGISDGKRDFDALAVVADTEEPFVPCGACLQLMAEFGVDTVVMANLNGDVKIKPLAEIIPCASDMLANRVVKRDDYEQLLMSLYDVGEDDDDDVLLDNESLDKALADLENMGGKKEE